MSQSISSNPTISGTASQLVNSHERNRRALAQLCTLYYQGEPYSQPGEWRKVMRYQSDLPVPQLYVNIPRMLIERIVQAGFASITGLASPTADTPAPAVKRLFQVVQPQLNEWVTQALVSGDLLLIARKQGEECLIRALPADCFALVPDDENPDDHGFAVEWLGMHKNEQHIFAEHHFVNRIVVFEPLPFQLGQTGERKLQVRAVNPRTSLEPMPTHIRNRPSTESYYGRSEFADLLRLVDDFNFKLSQRSRNISRTMNALIKSINGRIINSAIGDSEVVHVVGDNAQFDYLINDADMKPIEDHINALKWAIRETTGVTIFGLDDMKSIGQLSGFALRQLNRPMQALVNSKRATIGKDIERFLLSIRPLFDASYPENNVAPQLVYANEFEMSEQELSMQTDRIIKLLDKGIISAEEARSILNFST